MPRRIVLSPLVAHASHPAADEAGSQTVRPRLLGGPLNILDRPVPFWPTHQVQEEPLDSCRLIPLLPTKRIGVIRDHHPETGRRHQVVAGSEAEAQAVVVTFRNARKL